MCNCSVDLSNVTSLYIVHTFELVWCQFVVIEPSHLILLPKIHPHCVQVHKLLQTNTINLINRAVWVEIAQFKITFTHG